MNDKFFDLKKEKQDRMINGAMKVFAENGYKRASTDEMVKEATISKGLWFHYFDNKLGLYSFVFNYSIKYMTLELGTTTTPGETDFFKLFEQVEQTKLRVMKTYPYMPLFIESAFRETTAEAVEAIVEEKEVYARTLDEHFQKADLSRFQGRVNTEKLAKLIDYMILGAMSEKYTEPDFEPERLYQETVSYLTMLKELTYQ